MPLTATRPLAPLGDDEPVVLDERPAWVEPPVADTSDPIAADAHPLPVPSADAPALPLPEALAAATGEAHHAAPSELHESAVHTASGRWFSPGTALVVAMGALAWRLVDAYAKQALPNKVDSGASLDQFDTIVHHLPIGGDLPGMVFGIVLAVAALGLLAAGWRLRVREPLLQIAIFAVTILAIVAPLLTS